MVDGASSADRSWTFPCSRRNGIAGADHMRLQFRLREVFGIQSHDKIGISFFRADAKRFIEGIRRNVAPCRKGNLFRCRTNKANGGGNKVWPHLAELENGLVLVDNLFVHEPRERAIVDPLAQYFCAGYERAEIGGFERGDPGDQNGCVHHASRPFFLWVGQRR